MNAAGQVGLLHEGHDLRYYERVTELLCSTCERVEEEAVNWDEMHFVSWRVRIVEDGNLRVAVIDDTYPQHEDDDPAFVNAWVYCATCDQYVNYDESEWESDLE